MKSPSNRADAGTPPPPAPRLRTLGAVALERDGGTALGGRAKLLHLLAYLAGEGGRPVPRERLATLLWGDRPDARARASLREALSRLRADLPDVIEADRATVRVRPDRLAVDAREFEEAARQGRLERAAELYAGELLPGADAGAAPEFRAWLEAERARLDHLHRDALARLVEGAEARAAWPEAVTWAERWAEASPLSEDAHRALFQALTLAGRGAEAGALWATFADRAARELGVEPAPPPRPTEPAGPGPAVRRRVGSAAVFSPDLVGRREAFQRLVGAWEEAAGGGARGLLVRAEAGMGRTRLIRDFCAWLETRPETALLLRATGHAAERATPHALARPLLAPLRHARGLSGAADGALAELAAIVPEIRDRFPALPPLPAQPHAGSEAGFDAGSEAGSGSGARSAALEDALRRVVEDVAVEAPVVICVDDAHHADDDSLRLLLALARHPPPRTLLVLTAGVGAGSVAGVGIGDGVGGGTGTGADDAGRLDPAEVGQALDLVTLPPLTEAEVGAMVASMMAMEPDDRAALARLVHSASAGNPFVAGEQVATLVDEGHLRAGDDGVWRLEAELDPDRLPVPATVADATARRIARLPAPLRETLALAALLWPDNAPDLLAAVAGLTSGEAAERLDALLARRLLRPAPGGGWRYEFAHDVLRRVAYEAIPPHRRTALHAAAARVLLARGRQTEAAREAAARHRELAGERLLRRRPRWRRSRRALGTVSATALLAVAAIAWGSGAGGGADGGELPGTGSSGGNAGAPVTADGVPAALAAAPVLAVGAIEGRAADDGHASGPDSAAAALRDLLGTHLARLSGVRVVGGPRLVELAQLVELETGAPSCPAAAARRGGADELLDGSLYRTAAGAWRLDLRRLELASGVVRAAHTVEGATLFDLARVASARVAEELGVAPGPAPGDAASSRSAVALALYEEGLRNYYRGDVAAARQRFEAALEEDPGFAMAAYYAGLSAWHPDAPAAVAHLQRARTLAAGAGDRARLLIQGAWADLLDEPAAPAWADSLIARFPDEPMGYYLRGRALAKAGAFLDAVPFFRHVLEMGALAPGPRSTPRRGDDAAAELASALAMADSLPAAEAVIRGWIEREPGSALAWARLRNILEHQERFDEALAAAAVARRLVAAPDAYDIAYPALIDLKRGSFDAADSALSRLIREERGDVARQARWLRLISRRWQGRLDEALDDALALRRSRVDDAGGRPADTWPDGPDAPPPSDAPSPDALPPGDALAQAQVLFERGEHRRAAALFDSLAATFSTRASAGHSAHQRTWMLTHAADALAAAGDTAALAVLADSLERHGRRSSHGRDWILHHHVRGLIAVERGDLATAERELRQALFSRRAGFTRTNYELAGVLLDRGRPLEAVEILQPIFRSPVDVSNFYLARPRARALLGRAWLDAGRPDSALHHLRRVEAAWSRADPALDADRARIRRWIERAEAADRPR